jgi:hypothetical protein
MISVAFKQPIWTRIRMVAQSINHGDTSRIGSLVGEDGSRAVVEKWQRLAVNVPETALEQMENLNCKYINITNCSLAINFTLSKLTESPYRTLSSKTAYHGAVNQFWDAMVAHIGSKKKPPSLSVAEWWNSIAISKINKLLIGNNFHSLPLMPYLFDSALIEDFIPTVLFPSNEVEFLMNMWREVAVGWCEDYPEGSLKEGETISELHNKIFTDQTAWNYMSSLPYGKKHAGKLLVEKGKFNQPKPSKPIETDILVPDSQAVITSQEDVPQSQSLFGIDIDDEVPSSLTETPVKESKSEIENYDGEEEGEKEHRYGCKSKRKLLLEHDEDGNVDENDEDVEIEKDVDENDAGPTENEKQTKLKESQANKKDKRVRVHRLEMENSSSSDIVVIPGSWIKNQMQEFLVETRKVKSPQIFITISSSSCLYEFVLNEFLKHKTQGEKHDETLDCDNK